MVCVSVHPDSEGVAGNGSRMRIFGGFCAYAHYLRSLKATPKRQPTRVEKSEGGQSTSRTGNKTGLTPEGVGGMPGEAYPEKQGNLSQTMRETKTDGTDQEDMDSE